jgi:hypothetical protein
MKTAKLALALATLSIFSAAQSTPSDSWSNLNKITHKRAYRIETRDLKCAWAEINNASADSIIATVHNVHDSHAVKFTRAEVLFVSVDSVYYSGRSSWSDVAALLAQNHSRVKVVTKAGKIYKLKSPYKVTAEGIAPQFPAKKPTISKSEIAQVYEVLPKPLTANGEYLGEELGPFVIFDPDLYKYSLHLEGFLTVLRYDASQPEDNTPTKCGDTK